MSIFAATRAVLTTVPSRLRMQSYKPFPTYQNILHFFSQKNFIIHKKIFSSYAASPIANQRIHPIKHLTIKANSRASARRNSFVIISTTQIHPCPNTTTLRVLIPLRVLNSLQLTFATTIGSATTYTLFYM